MVGTTVPSSSTAPLRALIGNCRVSQPLRKRNSYWHSQHNNKLIWAGIQAVYESHDMLPTQQQQELVQRVLESVARNAWRDRINVGLRPDDCLVAVCEVVHERLLPRYLAGKQSLSQILTSVRTIIADSTMSVAPLQPSTKQQVHRYYVTATDLDVSPTTVHAALVVLSPPMFVTISVAHMDQQERGVRLLNTINCQADNEHPAVRAALSVNRNECAVCGATATSSCSKCRSVRYCGRVCQESDWRATHRGMCRGMRPLA